MKNPRSRSCRALQPSARAPSQRLAVIPWRLGDDGLVAILRLERVEQLEVVGHGARRRVGGLRSGGRRLDRRRLGPRLGDRSRWRQDPKITPVACPARARVTRSTPEAASDLANRPACHPLGAWDRANDAAGGQPHARRRTLADPPSIAASQRDVMQAGATAWAAGRSARGTYPHPRCPEPRPAAAARGGSPWAAGPGTASRTRRRRRSPRR